MAIGKTNCKGLTTKGTEEQQLAKTTARALTTKASKSRKLQERTETSS
jgi:hypothetical protein